MRKTSPYEAQVECINADDAQAVADHIEMNMSDEWFAAAHGTIVLVEANVEVDNLLGQLSREFDIEEVD